MLLKGKEEAVVTENIMTGKMHSWIFLYGPSLQSHFLSPCGMTVGPFDSLVSSLEMQRSPLEKPALGNFTEEGAGWEMEIPHLWQDLTPL